MKRFILACVLIYFTGLTSFAQRACSSYEYLQQELTTNSRLAKKISDIQAFTNNNTSKEYVLPNSSGLPVIVIPVVVHILYNTAVQNVSDAQVQSQIDALNRDFRKRNEDTVNTPAAFRQLASDCMIEFKLATVDPKGRATNGILRRQTNIQFFSIDDRIKSTGIGGDDPWDANSYLNIWVGNLAGGLMGYASYPGYPKEKEGVVVHYVAFGTTGTATAPYNKGRAATHEVGHWLGLAHIWGDEYCGDDHIDDTPPQRSPSSGCPNGVVVTCNNAPSGNMYMNYMDMTYDACVNLFTKGQVSKMRSMFAEGGPRNALLSSKALGVPLPEPVNAPIDNDDITIHLFPNPVHKTLTINVGSNEQMMGKIITIYSHLGQLVKQVKITQSVMQLNVIGLPQGLYFIRVNGRAGSYKIIKADN